MAGGLAEAFEAPPPPGGIIALDISTNAGWAYGAVGSHRPVFGSWDLPPSVPAPEDLGRCCASFENELLAAFERYGPRRAVIEAPMLTTSAKGQTNATTAVQQLGLYAVAVTACYRWEIQPVTRAVTTVRKRVLGRGRFENRNAAKEAVKAWCRGKGWLVLNDDEGDACVLWQYESWFQSPNGTRARAA